MADNKTRIKTDIISAFIGLCNLAGLTLQKNCGNNTNLIACLNLKNVIKEILYC